MAFLNQKERILDVVLTDRGRELLSKNLLEFSFFAFSDEGVDYSGSLSASLAQSASFDDYIHRGLSFEADQRTANHGHGRSVSLDGSVRGNSYRTLNTFLFTIPSRNRVVPEFKTSLDDSGNVVLRRSYFVNKISFRANLSPRLRQPLAYILRASLEKKSLEERASDYGLDQQIQNTIRKRQQNKSIVGLPLAQDYIALRGNSALNLRTGLVKTINEVFQLYKDRAIEKDGRIVRVPSTMEIVTGLDTVQVQLKLKGSEGEFESTDGFLIEVFESGSDGRLVKLQEKTVEDPIGDERLQDGFDSFMKVDVK